MGIYCFVEIPPHHPACGGGDLNQGFTHAKQVLDPGLDSQI